MTIKVKIRDNNKAVIKFDSAIHHAQEQQWFINTMRSIRDSDPTKHPKISIKDHNGEIPKLKPQKPPQKLTTEMIKKMEIQPIKGKPIKMEIKK